MKHELPQGLVSLIGYSVVVTGSVVLIGGDPGIGKSTILLQTATYMASSNSSALYVTGEESLSQVALRAQRLDLPTDKLKVMAETCVERIVKFWLRNALPLPY
jgi:DNA repair protein RadA/Sms